MEAKELQVWKEKFERVRVLLQSVWNFPYAYRVEFDTEHQGKECKLVVYQEKDGKLHMALTKETYEKAVQLSESEEIGVMREAREVLKYVEMLAESFEERKIKSILNWARRFPRNTRIESGKIRTSVEGVWYEVAEEKVRTLAQIDTETKGLYEEVLENVERERKIMALWGEIERNWVRRTLLGNILWIAGVDTGEYEGISYYGIEMDILPAEVKEKIKGYVVYLKNTKGIQDINLYVFPIVRRRPLPAGWYILDRNKDIVENILRELAQQQADNKDREIVEEYKKLRKEVLERKT